jgi:hypothetical protein
MYVFKLSSSPSSLRALEFPLAASISMRERRTPTSANSDATKKPFAKTRRKTTIM